MWAQHELNTFQFQTDNGEFASRKCRDRVAEKGETLVTNSPYSPETMSIIEWPWRTTGDIT